MRLGLKEGWAGRNRKTAVCPACSSDRARYSRRHYEGLWHLLFRVRPVKCSECGFYFPIARGATIRRPGTDLADLHIPFRPSELDDPAEGFLGAPEAGPSEPPGSTPSRRACPLCGSHVVRPSRPEGEQSLPQRLDIRTAYRCARCNASFMRTSPLRLLAFAAFLLGVLGGLSYVATKTLSGRGPSDRSPRIRKDQIKQPPPPVFR